MTLLTLREATPATSGRKASTLAHLQRAGFDVPDGFVIPLSEHRRHHTAEPRPLHRPDAALQAAIEVHLSRLLGGADEGFVAVRSSSTTEDGSHSSGAGQHDTILAVRGTHAVAAAVARCWASLRSPRAMAYRDHQPTPASGPPAMAVLVQRFIDADVSGVVFTHHPRVIEATHGLGDPLVSGAITPDSWTLDDTGITSRRAGTIRSRLDRCGDTLRLTPLPAAQRPCLDDVTVRELDRLGADITTVLRYPADIEWAISRGRIHTLQARPITAHLTGPERHADRPCSLGSPTAGVPASPGSATGPTRVLTGPRDFHRMQPGDIIVCHTSDPAWTPLFAHAAGIITEAGGALSHAAIVARELRIPAILAIANATTRYPDGTQITMDGTTGHIHVDRVGDPP